MKRILLTLLSLSLAATAAEPLVTVQSATVVTIDGVSFGKPSDAIANNPRLAPQIQRALEAWAAARATAQAAEIAELRREHQGAIDQLKSAHVEAVEQLKAAHAVAMADSAATRDQAAAELVAKTQRINTVLNGLLTQELQTGDGPRAQLLRQLLQEAAKPEERARLEALELQKAVLQAEIDKLAKP